MTEEAPTTPALARALILKLAERGERLATCESCTGGLISAALTAQPGASAVFDGGLVLYSYGSRALLGLSSEDLAEVGAVSEPAVAAAAEALLARLPVDWSLALSGIAGPTGGTPEKPVGTMCFAWSGREAGTRTQTSRLCGDRASIRAQAVEVALAGLLEHLR